jgi:hypothetical protein
MAAYDAPASIVQGGEYPFSIDVKGGEYRERGIFSERKTCKKKRSTKITKCFRQCQREILLEIMLSLLSLLC